MFLLDGENELKQLVGCSGGERRGGTRHLEEGPLDYRGVLFNALNVLLEVRQASVIPKRLVWDFYLFR